MNVESVPSESTNVTKEMTKKEMYSLLRSYTCKMKIPSHNYEKVVWLSKNLATKNSEHPDFHKAMRLVEMILEKGWS